MFWKTELLGEAKKTCAGCHENHVPFETYRLARDYYELDDCIRNCVFKRSGVELKANSELEIRSLREYLLFHYVLGGVIHDEVPEGIRRLGKGMALFLNGKYDDALIHIYKARGLVKAKQNVVQTHVIEGYLQRFMMNEAAEDRAFA